MPRCLPLLNAIFLRLALQFCCDTSCRKNWLVPARFLLATSTCLDFDWFILPCSHEFSRFFCWHQVLTSSVDWFILTCSYKFFRVFRWQQVLVSSFDLLILLSMTLVIGPDVRRWPEYETLFRKTPPKLHTSSNVFVGTNSCGQVVWIYGFISNRPRSIY